MHLTCTNLSVDKIQEALKEVGRFAFAFAFVFVFVFVRRWMGATGGLCVGCGRDWTPTVVGNDLPLHPLPPQLTITITYYHHTHTIVKGARGGHREHSGAPRGPAQGRHGLGEVRGKWQFG